MHVSIPFTKQSLTKTQSILAITGIVIFLYIISSSFSQSMDRSYQQQFGLTISDRTGLPIARFPNTKGHYAQKQSFVPTHIEKLIVLKEDRFFYYHLGFNPGSWIRGFMRYLKTGKAGGTSTITEQLAKILLNHENSRTLSNKLQELLYAVSLELHHSKKEILSMYTAVIYFGNQAQGLNEASALYFKKSADTLDDGEILRLLATISSPTTKNPWKDANTQSAQTLAKRFALSTTSIQTVLKRPHQYQTLANFELSTLGLTCKDDCNTTLDLDVTERLRTLLARHLENATDKNIKNGSIVVIKEPEHELLAIVGSPRPTDITNGTQINMAIEPRPIGSTAKPFIYLEAFKRGLRPYTLVEDREYRFGMGEGFSIYPKNYDGIYHGTVTLHQALANSYNVPAVKVLEYVGLEQFYSFLLHDLGFTPIQDLSNYQYGIALGGLETDLLTLSHLFSIFTNHGILKPLTVNKNSVLSASPLPHRAQTTKNTLIAEEKYIELVNKILSDREAGIEQFGQKSNLNLTQNNYALKTGTSRDYHDSWIVGYTPDFIVGVWIGNSDNTALRAVSGASGAGSVWHDAMELLFSTTYNKKTPFSFSHVAEFQGDNMLEYGLPEDAYDKQRMLLSQDNVILKPHDGDVFQLSSDKKLSIPLSARQSAQWYVANELIGTGQDSTFYPSHSGVYEIRALAENKQASVRITIEPPPTSQ